jgi:hypothetical protein
MCLGQDSAPSGVWGCAGVVKSSKSELLMMLKGWQVRRQLAKIAEVVNLLHSDSSKI